MNKCTITSILLFSIITFFQSSPYCANEKTKPENSDFRLEAITVTARKIEENKQNVPISMDAFSSTQLEDAAIATTQGLIRHSPNSHMKYNYYENMIVIRGISTIRASIYSPAAFYVDDVCYPLQYMQNAELYDIERAEILKGPQGALYGRNAESGVVNIITKRPADKFEGKATEEFASYKTVRSSAIISGPAVKERLFLRGAFQYKSSSGFVKNLSNGNEQSADIKHLNGRSALLWTPTDRLDVSLIAEAMDADDHCGGHRFISGPQKTEPYEHRSDADEYYVMDGNNEALKIKYHGDGFDILSVSGILNNNLDKLNDTDLWDDPKKAKYHTNEFEEKQYSQEIRISSTGDGPFQWIGGLYGFMDETDINYKYHLVSSGTIYMNPVTDLDTTGLAAFAQGSCAFSEKLNLTAGLRFDHQTMEGQVIDSIRKKSCDGELHYDEWLPKISAAYDVWENIMCYLSASKGYLAGGYNFSMSPEKDVFTYDPEYTWNYEAGVRTCWFNNRMTANLSVFYIDIADKQVMEYDWKTLAKTISNAAEAHSQGIELQLEAMPLKGLSLFAGIGINEAEFDDFICTEKSGSTLLKKNYSGNYLPYAPKHKCNCGVQYRTYQGWFARADWFGTGKFYGDAANLSEQDAYQTVNVRIGYETRHFDLYVYADNIFNEEYLTFVYPYNDYAVGLDGEPQILGAMLNLRY